MKNNTIFLSPNARLILEKRYLKKDASGNPIKSTEVMFRRIAKNAASADFVYNKKADIISPEERFYDLMTSQIPGPSHKCICF